MSIYGNVLISAGSEYKNTNTLYSYSAESYVRVSKCLDSEGTVREIHEIWYPGVPSSSTHANAPDGSVCYDTTNGDVYIKLAATKPGTGIAGAWTKASP